MYYKRGEQRFAVSSELGKLLNDIIKLFNFHIRVLYVYVHVGMCIYPCVCYGVYVHVKDRGQSRVSLSVTLTS